MINYLVTFHTMHDSFEEAVSLPSYEDLKEFIRERLDAPGIFFEGREDPIVIPKGKVECVTMKLA